MAEREIEKWITINGRRVPIYKKDGGVKTFEEYSDTSEVDDWFYDNSNYGHWKLDGVSKEQLKAIKDYAEEDAQYINKSLYEASDRFEHKAGLIQKALDNFELHEPIQVSRESGFEIFGGASSVEDIKTYLEKNNGKRIPAFMSASAGGQRSYASPGGKGLMIEIEVPAGKGKGAYIGGLSRLSSENEFLINRNQILDFDTSSIRQHQGNIIIKARIRKAE